MAVLQNPRGMGLPQLGACEDCTTLEHRFSTIQNSSKIAFG